MTSRQKKGAQPKPKTKSAASRTPLCEHVRGSLCEYFSALNGHDPSDLYELVVSEVEQPLLEVVLDQTGGNLSKAAGILGINRGTLRKKLRKYGLS